MINAKMQEAINQQINAELASGYLYLSMSAYFESTNLLGFANWMRVQAQEELMHAMKFYDYLNQRGGRVDLRAVAGPVVSWDSPLHAFEETLVHEIKVTGLINQLVDLSRELSDHATHNFLQWFVAEQVEEEASADEVIQRLKLVGKDGAGLFMLDRELAARTFVAPTATDAT